MKNNDLFCRRKLWTFDPLEFPVQPDGNPAGHLQQRILQRTPDQSGPRQVRNPLLHSTYSRGGAVQISLKRHI